MGHKVRKIELEPLENRTDLDRVLQLRASWRLAEETLRELANRYLQHKIEGDSIDTLAARLLEDSANYLRIKEDPKDDEGDSQPSTDFGMPRK